MDQDLTTQMIKDLLSKVTVGDTEEETTPATTGLMSSLPGTKTPENVAKEEEANDTPKARTTISKFINDLADAREAEEAEDDTQYVTKETPEVSDILSLNTELLQNRHNTPLYDFIRKNKNINLDDGAISVRDRGDAGIKYIKRIGDMLKKDYTIPSARPDVSVQRKPSVVLDLDLFMEKYDAEDEVGAADVDISVMPDITDAVGGAATDKKGLMVKPQTDDDLGLPTQRSEDEEIIALEPMFKFISKGEGGYNASNRGTIKGKGIQGSTNNTTRDGKKLTEMTIAEIKAKQSITDPNNKDRLFAVGRFQTIPNTLDMAINGLNLSDDTVFNEATQDKIGRYLITQKRKGVGKYLSGDTSISKDAAMQLLAKEFASFPVPKDQTIKRGGKTVELKKGDSYYGSGNKAQHTLKK